LFDFTIETEDEIIIQSNQKRRFINKLKTADIKNKITTFKNYLSKLKFLIKTFESDLSPEEIIYKLHEYLQIFGIPKNIYGFGIDIFLNVHVLDDTFIEFFEFADEKPDSLELSVSNYELIYLKLFESENYNDLCCENNFLTHLDVPKNVIYLDCSDNLLKTLKTKNNILEILCYNNYIENINVNNPIYFSIHENEFNKIIINDETFFSDKSHNFLNYDYNIVSNYIKLHDKINKKFIINKNRSLIIEKTFVLLH
jgi:hypothetical protein